jgi:hypothetical protein
MIVPDLCSAIVATFTGPREIFIPVLNPLVSFSACDDFATGTTIRNEHPPAAQLALGPSGGYQFINFLLIVFHAMPPLL